MAQTRQSIPFGNTISAAWTLVGGSKGVIWGALIITFIISFAVSFISGGVSAFSSPFGSFLSFIGSILMMLLNAGMLYIGICRAKQAPIEVKQVFRALNLDIALSTFGVYLILFLLVALVGFVFFFLPLPLAAAIIILGPGVLQFFVTAMYIIGVALMAIIIIRLSLALSYVLDRTTPAFDAIRLSYEATRGHFWALFFIYLFVAIIIPISAIPFGIGLIWSLPFACICYGVIYQRLSGV